MQRNLKKYIFYLQWSPTILKCTTERFILQIVQRFKSLVSECSNVSNVYKFTCTL